MTMTAVPSQLLLLPSGSRTRRPMCLLLRGMRLLVLRLTTSHKPLPWPLLMSLSLLTEFGPNGRLLWMRQTHSKTAVGELLLWILRCSLTLGVLLSRLRMGGKITLRRRLLQCHLCKLRL